MNKFATLVYDNIHIKVNLDNKEEIFYIDFLGLFIAKFIYKNNKLEFTGKGFDDKMNEVEIPRDNVRII